MPVFELDQTKQYEQLRYALEVMGVANESTPSPEAAVLMYLLGEGQLNLDIEQQVILRARVVYPEMLALHLVREIGLSDWDTSVVPIHLFRCRREKSNMFWE